MFYCNKYKPTSGDSQKKTCESLSTINFSTDDIQKIISNLDPSKARRHEMNSIRMIKICDTSICRSLKLIFQSCLKVWSFLRNGKSICGSSSQERWQANIKKTTDQYHYFIVLVRSLKDYYMTGCLSFWLKQFDLKVIWYLKINWVL